MKNETITIDPIDKIVTDEAINQINLLINKLKEAQSLEKKLGNSVAMKIAVLSDLLGDGGQEIKVDIDTFKLINNKLKELIPLL